MRSFFRSLDAERVRYLLISGQACVLYGASHFTEDVDLWVEPSGRNLNALRRALGRARAVVHKLTPPLGPRYARRGHGFHFRIGDDLYVDVMGRPPRVGSFARAAARKRLIRTDWGTLPVAAPEDLVLLKRTNRPSDYETISNLVAMRVREAPGDGRVLRWAIQNTFDGDDLVEFASAAAGRLRAWPVRKALAPIVPVVRRGLALSDPKRRAVSRLLALEAADLQEKGRSYWIPVLTELKRLRARGRLLPEGMPVRLLPAPR